MSAPHTLKEFLKGLSSRTKDSVKKLLRDDHVVAAVICHISNLMTEVDDIKKEEDGHETSAINVLSEVRAAMETKVGESMVRHAQRLVEGKKVSGDVVRLKHKQIEELEELIEQLRGGNEQLRGDISELEQRLEETLSADKAVNLTPSSLVDFNNLMISEFTINKDRWLEYGIFFYRMCKSFDINAEGKFIKNVAETMECNVKDWKAGEKVLGRMIKVLSLDGVMIDYGVLESMRRSYHAECENRLALNDIHVHLDNEHDFDVRGKDPQKSADQIKFLVDSLVSGSIPCFLVEELKRRRKDEHGYVDLTELVNDDLINDDDIEEDDE